LLLDSNATEKNMMEYVKELADDSSSSSSSFYQRALSFYEGTLDYSFIDEEGIKEEIESIKSISNTAKWLAIASSGLKNYGSSSIAFFTTPNTTILEDGTSINQYTLIPGRLFDYLSPEINETSLKTMASDMYQDLGLSSEEIENHSSAFVSFSKKQWTAYRSTDIAKYQNTFSLLYDSATKSDPITSFGLSFDLAGAFINAGFSYDDISKFATIDLAAYLSLAKAVTEATPAELCSTALYNFAYDNSDLKKYHQGTKPDFELVRTMINNRLSSDYASSSLYTQSYNTIKTMFTGIESVFSDRLTNSSWLSDDGKKKAQEKLDAIQTNFLGKSDDGTVFDYSSLAAPLGKTISKTIGGAKRNLVNYFLSRVSTGIDNDEKSLIASGPFFGNAFYYPSYNRISLNLGALFYVGSDLSKVSQEELYARIGFVLGHEITHGFDSQGVYYDKNGNHSTTSIIPEADQSKFDELALKLEGLYKDQEIVPGLSQDAHLTITEDLADTGGMVFFRKRRKGNNCI
jgi:putative endopeptidase